MKRLAAIIPLVALLIVSGFFYAAASENFEVDLDSPVEAFSREVRVLAEVADAGALYDNLRKGSQTEALVRLQVFKEVLNAASGRRLIGLLDGIKKLTGFEISEKMLIDLFGERAAIGLFDRGENRRRQFLAVARVGAFERLAAGLLEFRDSMADEDKQLISTTVYKGAKLETLDVGGDEGPDLHYLFGGGYLLFANDIERLKQAVDTMVAGSGSSLATEKNYAKLADGFGKNKKQIRIFVNGNLPQVGDSRLADRVKYMLLKAAPGTMVQIAFEDRLTVTMKSRLDGVATGSPLPENQKIVAARPPDKLLPDRTVAVIDNLGLSSKYLSDVFLANWFVNGNERSHFEQYNRTRYDFDVTNDLFGVVRTGAVLAIGDVDFVLKRGFGRQVLYLPFTEEDEAQKYGGRLFQYVTKRTPYSGSYMGVAYGAVENPEEEYNTWTGNEYVTYRLDVPAYCWLEGYLIIARDFETLRGIIERALLGELVSQLKADKTQLAGLIDEAPANRLIDRVAKATGIKEPIVVATLDGPAFRGLVETYLFDLDRMNSQFIYEDAAVRLVPLAESLAFLGNAKMALNIEQGELEAKLVWGEE